ncbi:uncharacterized protein LOC100905459 [Galendromus occidentalis]|uniref:Uncharacterized protein LOC100905459 n=1 Tax=Galendromus occidentalis TaxID=34638 RepID=A0AAJ6VUP8_9ACAR|nr:uncharacterized protein LOC100905459 [Galendromus occidentalis]
MMSRMRSTFVLTVFVLTLFSNDSSATGDQHRDINEGFKKYLEEVLQNLRSNMGTGIPELKIPPLDPLSVPDNVNGKTKVGNIQVDRIKVEGLKTLELKHIDADLNNLAAGITIHIGKFLATAKYNCDLLIARLFPIKGYGNLHIEFRDVTLQAKIVLKSEDFSMFEVTHISYAVQLGGSKVDFENIINPQLAPTINKILSGSLPLITDQVLPKVNGRLTPLLIKLLNKELTKVKITDLIDKINKK